MGDQELYLDDKVYEAARLHRTDIPYSSVEEWQTRNNSAENDREFFLHLTPGDGSNVLHVAAQYGNNSSMKIALDTCGLGLLCNKNFNGETPFHLAAEFGHTETAKALHEAHRPGDQLIIRCHPNQLCWSVRDNKGDTPLHRALRNGHDDLALLLLDWDRQLGLVVNDIGESPTYIAADNFCHNFLLTILDYHPSIVSFSGPFGQTFFHAARRLSDHMITSILMMCGNRAPLRAQDNHGKTALHYAIEENRESLVETLLKEDSSLAFMHDNDGLTPLHRAARMGSSRMILTILELSPQSLMIRTGAQLNRQTALHVARMKASSLNELLRNTRMKELINKVDNDGNTPLHLALINSDLDIAYTLLKVDGINGRLRNNSGCNAMDLCRLDYRIPSHMFQIYLALTNLEARDPESQRRNKLRLFVSRFFPFRSLFTIDLESMTEEELKQLLNNIAVAAALIVTVTFAAPFAAPGGYNDKSGGAKLGKLPVFRLFIVSDMAALLASIMVLLQYTYGIGKRVNTKLLARVSIVLLKISLSATIFAFLAGVTAIFPHVQGWVTLGPLTLTAVILMLHWILIIQYVSVTGFFN